MTPDMTRVQAQHLYDRRERFEEISGDQLVALFRLLVNDPAPPPQAAIKRADVDRLRQSLIDAAVAHRAAGTVGWESLRVEAGFLFPFSTTAIEILPPGWRRCVHCGAAYVPTGLAQRYCASITCQRARRSKKQRAWLERRAAAGLADAAAIVANS